MFKENHKHIQNSIFGIHNTLPEALLKKLENSSQHIFYKLIFCNIREHDFSVLYSDKASRPNAPINSLVSSMIMKQKHNWSDSELFEEIAFNLLTKTALGLDKIDDIPFDESTYYNFQNRLKNYYIETGINLLELVFDSLTKQQIKQLHIKTDIQRTDSMMACSNIRQYSRLQLLIEVLLRLWRVLNQADKSLLSTMFDDYTKKSSGQYIYKLKSSDIPHELDKVAQIYHYCHQHILPNYQSLDLYPIFERVYNEHFTEISDKIELKDTTELHSGCLQSPDDVDATYRVKREEEYRGQVINVVETASPDNKINLITDVAVATNNTDDSVILNERIDQIKEKTPDINEIHEDGAYGSADNDQKFKEYDITAIQTAVRGRQSGVFIEIKQLSESSYKVKCPNQTVLSIPTEKRYKAEFDKGICNGCQLADKCPSKEMKNNRTYYFTEEDYLRNQRIRNILEIPPERRKIRPNVEATVKEFSCRLNNGKLKLRGSFGAIKFAFATAISINFGRIFRYMLQYC